MHEHQIHHLSSNHMYFTHAVCNEHNKDIIQKYKMKCVHIIRDPRDQVASLAYWMQKYPQVHSLNMRLPVSQLIYRSIYRFGDAFARVFPKNILYHVQNLHTLYDLYLPWMDEPGVLTVRFEHLVGPNGYDCENEEQKDFYLKRQLTEIKRIADYLELNVSDHEIYNVALKLTGGTRTYRKGKVGDWKNNFTAEHEQAFHDVAGDLLEKMGYA
jgi:hypothetical protein